MASRKEEKERRRRERLEREQQRHKSAGRRRQVAFALGGLAVIAAAVVAVVLVIGGEDGSKPATKKAVAFKDDGIKPPSKKVKDLKQAAAKAGCDLRSFRSEGREHLAPGDKRPKYKTNPPTSGRHDPEPLADGAYIETPKDFAEKAIHSLEHGRIEVQFRNITSRQERQLKGLFDEDDYHLILMPNLTNMPYQVAGVAWTKLLTCKKMNNASFDAIRAFVDKNVDQGPELVP